MKKLSILGLMVAGILAVQSCDDSNSSNHSTEGTMGDTSGIVNNDGTSMSDMNNGANGATASSTLSDDDNKFLLKAASGGMMEVELGRLAEQKASSAKVKEFGTMMATDHSKANDELKSIAQSKGVNLPAMMNDDHQKHVKNLSEKSGADFDKAYIKMMVDDHKEDVDDFEECSKDSKDADLKAFTTKTLPVLQKHLASAKTLNDSMN